MLSEKKAKGPKGDKGVMKNEAHQAKIDNMRKHDKLLQIMTNDDSSESQIENKAKNSRLKGDNGKVLSHSEKKWLHSFFGHDPLHANENQKMSTNSQVLDKLSKIDEERKQILTKFDSSQREGSGVSDQDEEQNQGNENETDELGKVPKQVYEKHQRLFEELSQFFPSRNHHLSEKSSIRPKRHRLEEYDESNYELYPDEIYDDENEDEDNEELDDDNADEQVEFARAIDPSEYNDEFDSLTRSRRSLDDSTDNQLKRKLSPNPSENFDEYGRGASSLRPEEVPYDSQKQIVSYKEATVNSVFKVSSEKATEEEMNQPDPVYERQKLEYLKKEFGSGMTINSGEEEDNLGPRSGNGQSDIRYSPVTRSSLKENNSAKTLHASQDNSARVTAKGIEAAKINMKGPKIGTDPGRPVYMMTEKYNEEKEKHKDKLNRKKKKKKYKEQTNGMDDLEGQTELKNDEDKTRKKVSDLGEEMREEQKSVHVGKTGEKTAKGTKSGESKFSQPLGKIGKAKSRRKRIKLVMEKRKRKAERSLNGDLWSPPNKVMFTKMVLIGS